MAQNWTFQLQGLAILPKNNYLSNFFDRDARRSGPTIHFVVQTLVQNLL